MKRFLEVCLVALTLTAGLMPCFAVQSFPLQKGISVELPVTRNAVPVPDADRQDALILAVTEDGHLYLGIAPTNPTALAGSLKASLSNGSEKKLYLKADARAQYAGVKKVLDAVRAAGVRSLILLTGQSKATTRGARVPPYGLEVRVGPPPGEDSGAAVVQVLDSGQQRAELKVNNGRVAWTSLQNKLRRLFRNRIEKTVLVKADGTLPYGYVVRVADVCRSLGTQVVLAGPGRELRTPTR